MATGKLNPTYMNAYCDMHTSAPYATNTNPTYSYLLSKGYNREVLLSILANQFTLDRTAKLATTRYFLLRYSAEKLFKRSALGNTPGRGTITVGSDIYAMILCGADVSTLTTCNFEVSFRVALPEYGLPAIALVRPFAGEVL